MLELIRDYVNFRHATIDAKTLARKSMEDIVVRPSDVGWSLFGPAHIPKELEVGIPDEWDGDEVAQSDEDISNDLDDRQRSYDDGWCYGD